MSDNYRKGMETEREAESTVSTIGKLSGSLFEAMIDGDDLRNYKGMTLAQANSAKYQLVKNAWDQIKKKVSEVKNTTLRIFLEREYLDKVKSTVKVYLGSKIGQLLNSTEISLESLYNKVKSVYKQRNDLITEASYVKNI